MMVKTIMEKEDDYLICAACACRRFASACLELAGEETLGTICWGSSSFSGCESEEEKAEEKSNYITDEDYNLYSLNGDNVLDSASQGRYWDTEPKGIIRFSTLNGFGGQTFSDQTYVAELLKTALNNLANYADLNIEYIGHFSDLEVTSDLGRIVNLTLDS